MSGAAGRCRSWLLLLLLLLSLLGCTGCKEKPEADGYFRVDISADPDTLDPQTASGQTAQTILEACMEGLYRLDENGDPVPALAQDHKVSPDGLTHTFTLRPDGCWYQPAKGETEAGTVPVTADDFVFAFQRLFDPATGAADARNFSFLKNGQQILAGQQPVTALGVSAPRSDTLVLQLDRPSGNLLSLLATTVTYPCSRALFDSTNGRYGLEADTIWCNGPFYLREWNHDKNVVTRRNPGYYDRDSILPAGVSFYCQDPADFIPRFLAGETDAVSFDGESLALFTQEGYQPVSFQDTTWVLLFRQDSVPLNNRNVRLALCRTLDLTTLRLALPESYTAAGSLVPGCVEQEGVRYLDRYPDSAVPAFDLPAAKESLRMGLEEESLSSFPACTVLVPESGSHSLLMSLLQPVWQKQLLCFVNIQKLSADRLLSAVNGDCQMALVPLQTHYNSPEAVLQSFVSNARGNVTGYRDPHYDWLLSQAGASESNAQAMSYYRQAEQRLLDNGVVVPLYYSSTYYAAAKGTEGIRFSPFGGRMDFRFAQK